MEESILCDPETLYQNEGVDVSLANSLITKEISSKVIPEVPTAKQKKESFLKQNSKRYSRKSTGLSKTKTLKKSSTRASRF